MNTTVISPKWLTTAEVAVLLRFGLSKTKMLILEGEIRSVKVGRNRRILPSWVDDYVARVTADPEGWSA
ncbi:excisionase family DNA-binding protein [Streptomyces sp. NPDC097619]|uniref:excisionase family DNA-binding protein n=1 Tax=Streptomyces sp. NPDC097619 TaxID=3157228 RepID=UPI003320CC94